MNQYYCKLCKYEGARYEVRKHIRVIHKIKGKDDKEHSRTSLVMGVQ